ncbi:F0F1 ATP synthase subunit delta [Parabacteroides sp. FAFU027]|uniref:F0F1 ATP synthase subunit delta n=1 Tax=Parabacteroides sp. FAFU027 TaxID=2922715 RepID=UPI001FAEF7AC|nr:F0F1 ATP synthase subunit delta [Parabacteroides sp. FAFU027]
MEINGFIVAAQIINFLILVWLLKKFLYKPILKAVEEREKKIVARLKEAEAIKAEAEKEQAEFIQKNEAFEQEKQALMSAFTTETNEKRQQLLEEARHDAEVLRDNLKAVLAEAQESLSREIRQKAQEEIFAIARKVFTELASTELEEQAVAAFIRKINSLSGEEKEQFNALFKENCQPVKVHSAFLLNEKQQTEIVNAVSQITGIRPQCHFETSPHLVSGIELIANGHKIDWSIDEYLHSLQSAITETIKAKPEADKDAEE